MSDSKAGGTYGPQAGDVRMRGFQRRATVDEAWRWLDGQLQVVAGECVPLADAAGRVLADDVVASVDVPGFDRAMMDGYAVHADDTTGASSYNRLSLEQLGQSLPGAPFEGTVGAGQAVRIMTGAPLPPGADAVLPAEKAEADAAGRVAAIDAVPPGKHVGLAGEDVSVGTRVLARLRVLRPQDLGVLSSIGVDQVPVVRRPRVRILVTGNELLPAGTRPEQFRIADANGPMLAALVARDGGQVESLRMVADSPQAIFEALQAEVEVLLVSGGSSVGQEDHAPLVVQRHGELAIHGVAMRPSSPAGLGRLGERLVFLLPGNPVSCLCAYDFFAGRAIRALGGRSRQWPYRTRVAPLQRKLVSTVGRVDYARVQLAGERVEPLAISGASILSSTTRADGFVVVPADSEGYPAGTPVSVYLYD